MMPGIKNGGSYEHNFEKQMEKQMGCMAGFLQLFHRHQIIAGKRFNSAKRLPTSPTSAESLSPSERSDVSSTSFVRAAPPSPSSQSLDACLYSPENHFSVSSSMPFPVFEVKGGIKTSWKLRESPRLSLDSRGAFDPRGKLPSGDICATHAIISGDSSDFSDTGHDNQRHRRSPSVVARLMGLDDLPIDCIKEQPNKPELRRSASESGVSRNLLQLNFQKSAPISEQNFQQRKDVCPEFSPRNSMPQSPRSLPVSLQRKSYYDTHEFFPEVNRAKLMYGDIWNRLRIPGIEGPSKDFETLKQIVEALQLKGLLRTKPLVLPAVGRLDAINNCVPQNSAAPCPRVTITKLQRKSQSRISGSDRFSGQNLSTSFRRTATSEVLSSAKTRRDPVRKIATRPAEPSELLRSPVNSPVRRRPANVGAPTASNPERRIHAFKPPLASPKRSESYQISARSPKIRHASLKEKHNANMSDCRIGQNILERCDKLMYNIAAITSSADQIASSEQQPSPVSVLDSNFLLEENSTSPFPKRSIDFKDEVSNWEDHRKNKAKSSSRSEFNNGSLDDFRTGQIDDYAYVADVVRDTTCHGCPADIFSALEYRHVDLNSGTSMATVLHRRLVFDTVTEIIERKRGVTPWTIFIRPPSTSMASNEGSILSEVWEEVQCLRDHPSTGNAMEITGEVIKQDMAATSSSEQEWTVLGAEMSTAILHIERLLFKDLVADAIQALDDLPATHRTTTLPRRKLIF